ncbi:MAG: TonB-dependent receptor [Steroidobacteraceae bacterium]
MNSYSRQTGRALLVASFVSLSLAGSHLAFSQEAAASADDSVTLEEIVVTAERRSEDLQKLGSSVVSISGAELAEQGKQSTQQILEGIPNVIYDTGRSNDNPNGNISIRGVRSTGETGGGAPPSATATYVDEVYQGIGGNYDLSRVEVLRGPQGTLYGRSATGGVVAFHTNDPVLGQTSTQLIGEYGTAALRDGTVVVNVPLSDVLAIRVAGHDREKDGYWSKDGGATSTQEGRIKALYQPNDQFKLVLAASSGIQTNGSGGNTPTLTDADTIDYVGTVAEVSSGYAQHNNQFSVNASYQFEPATLTYVGSLRTFQTNGTSGGVVHNSGVQKETIITPLDQFNTHEIRLASNSDGPLTWQVGGSFYSNIYDTTQSDVQVEAYLPGSTDIDTTDGTENAFIFSQRRKGSTKDYGLFTEETYKVRDDLRVTAGVRFDKTKVDTTAYEVFNTNLDDYLASLSPADNELYTSRTAEDFNNFTYKLRAEYDLTPSNMLYALTATGFLPGDAQLSPVVQWDLTNGMSFAGVEFAALPFKQEKLTSYEIGSKNRFLDDRLQVNGAVFYYDYQGYQEAVNTAVNSPVPQFVVIAVPVRMVGLDADAAYALTGADRLTASLGLIDAKITGYPDLGSTLGSAEQYLALKRLPGVPTATATLGYDHTFTLGNGAKLVARADGRYVAGGYVEQMTVSEVTLGEKAYAYQSAYVIGNVGVTWTSPESRYSVTGYARNVGDKIYKSSVTLNAQAVSNILVTPSDPRTLGVQVSAKF